MKPIKTLVLSSIIASSITFTACNLDSSATSSSPETPQEKPQTTEAKQTTNEPQVDPNHPKKSTKANEIITVLPSGAVCSLPYKPLCANGVDYSTTCEAEADHVKYFEWGTCEEVQKKENQNNPNQPKDESTRKDAPSPKDSVILLPNGTKCSLPYQPVCANGVNYFNTCDAEAAQVKAFEFGTCEDIQKKEKNTTPVDKQLTPAEVAAKLPAGYGCAVNYDPVCANGITYSNTCHAQVANVPQFQFGACNSNRPQQPKDITCRTSNNPFCGDGITYNNSCEAKKANLQIVNLGACEEKCPASPKFKCLEGYEWKVSIDLNGCESIQCLSLEL
jgi:hypothetical protein